jgi:hypothetical protein
MRAAGSCVRASRTHKAGGSDNIGRTNTYPSYSMCTSTRTDHSRDAWCSCACACVQDAQIIVIRRCCTCPYMFDVCTRSIGIHPALSMCTSLCTDHSKHARGLCMRVCVQDAQSGRLREYWTHKYIPYAQHAHRYPYRQGSVVFLRVRVRPGRTTHGDQEMLLHMHIYF